MQEVQTFPYCSLSRFPAFLIYCSRHKLLLNLSLWSIQCSAQNSLQVRHERTTTVVHLMAKVMLSEVVGPRGGNKSVATLALLRLNAVC